MASWTRIGTAAITGALLVLATPGGPRAAIARQEPPAVEDWLASPAPGAARLVLREARELQLFASVRHRSPGCEGLEAVVQVLQGGELHAVSRDCLEPERTQTRTELVAGGGADRQIYEVAFDYSSVDGTVAYSLRRVQGSGLIASQRLLVELGGPP